MRKILLLLIFCMSLAPGTARSEDFYEARLNSGLKNSDTYAYLLINESRANKPEAEKILKKALLYSPDLPAVYFELARASFSFSPAGLLDSLDYIVRGVDAYSRDFWWSFTLAGFMYFSALISFVLAFTVIMIIRLFSDIRMLSHDTAEANVKPAFMIIPVLLAFVSPLLFIAAVLIFLGLYMRKIDRLSVYFFLFFLAVSPLLFKGASLFISSFSSGHMKAVVQVNDSKDNRYALSLLNNSDDNAELFSYGVALKREGRFDEAITVFNKLLTKKADPKVLVNLGNCYVGLYNFDEKKKNYLQDALGYYQEAVKLKPLASAYYNLSQVSRELIDFAHGNEYFASALSLDRNAVSDYSAVNSRNPNRFVVDETLLPADIWRYARQRSGKVFSFGLVSTPLVMMTIIALFLMAGFTFFTLKTKQKAYRCKKCGTVLCPKCEKRLTWGQLCPQCYGSLVKPDEMQVRERVARLLSIYEKQSRRRRILKILSFILPGSPQIYAGKILYGLLFLWPFLFFLSMPLIESVIVTESTAFSHELINVVSLLAAGALYIIANIVTRKRISKGWL